MLDIRNGYSNLFFFKKILAHSKKEWYWDVLYFNKNLH